LFLGIVYQDLLYIADSSNAEYFDPATNIWTAWPNYLTPIQTDACLVLWQDNFLLIDPSNMQTFDLATNIWTTEALSPPLPLDHPACLTLPNNKVLIVGSGGLPLLFDPATKTWTTLPPTINSQGKVTLLQLGQRYFIFGGNSTETIAQEFRFRTNTWRSVTGGPVPTTNSQGYASGVAVPNVLFTNLSSPCTGGILGRKIEEESIKKINIIN
jgi:hypothetical protein